MTPDIVAGILIVYQYLALWH